MLHFISFYNLTLYFKFINRERMSGVDKEKEREGGRKFYVEIEKQK